MLAGGARHQFKPKLEVPRATGSRRCHRLKAKKAFFPFVAEVKLMFVDVNKAHFKAGCDEEDTGGTQI